MADSSAATIRGHVFCAFLALVLAMALNDLRVAVDLNSGSGTPDPQSRLPPQRQHRSETAISSLCAGQAPAVSARTSAASASPSDQTSPKWPPSGLPTPKAPPRVVLTRTPQSLRYRRLCVTQKPWFKSGRHPELARTWCWFRVATDRCTDKAGSISPQALESGFVGGTCGGRTRDLY